MGRVRHGTETSDWSTPVSATTEDLSPPSGVSVGTVTSDSVALRWDPVTAATGYEVHRDFSDAHILDADASTNYTVTGLSADTQYDFEVRATHGTHTSGWSTEVTATTDPTAPPPPVM